MMQFRLVCSALLLALAGAELVTGSGDGGEIQAINSFLTALPSSYSPREIVDDLTGAMDTISSVGADEFVKLDKAQFKGTKLACLADDLNPGRLVDNIQLIISSAESCDEDSLTYLFQLAEDETRPGQVLNEFARLRIEECEQMTSISIEPEQVALFQVRLERSLDKMSSALVELLLDVGRALARKKATSELVKAAPRGNRAAITINEPTGQQASMNPLDALRLVSLASRQQLDDALAQELRSQYDGATNSQLNSILQSRLVDPCKDLDDRITSLGAAIVGRKLEQLIKKLTESVALTGESLGTELEVHKVCKQLTANPKALLSRLRVNRFLKP